MQKCCINRKNVEGNAIVIPKWTFRIHFLRHGFSCCKFSFFPKLVNQSIIKTSFQLYLQSRMKWRGSRLLKHFLQFMLMIIAWFTALSRISDYKHHWSDVLAGSVIGILFAFLVVSCFYRNSTKCNNANIFTIPQVNFVSDFFVTSNDKILPTSQQDVSGMRSSSTTVVTQIQANGSHSSS